jgi:hypothetical protein
LISVIMVFFRFKYFLKKESKSIKVFYVVIMVLCLTRFFFFGFATDMLYDHLFK